jgi:hypothetical protein
VQSCRHDIPSPQRKTSGGNVSFFVGVVNEIVYRGFIMNHLYLFALWGFVYAVDCVILAGD